MKYSDLLEKVEYRAGVGSAKEAREATQVVLRGLVSVVPRQALPDLFDSTPSSLEPASALTPQDLKDDPAGFVRAVADGLGCSPERARYLIRAVLSALVEQDRDIAGVLAARLPDDMLTPPFNGVASVDANTSGHDVAQPIDNDRLQRWLAAHRQWSGDTRRLRRTINLPADRLPPLLAAVERDERRIKHNARVDHNDSDVTFELWTHSIDHVTDLDLHLAQLIDDVVARVGSGG